MQLIKRRGKGAVLKTREADEGQVKLIRPITKEGKQEKDRK